MSEADRFGGKGGDGRRINMTPPQEQEIPRKQGTGQSGTGQDSPHHGYDDRQGRSAIDAASEHVDVDEPRGGASYQSGGTSLDRDVVEEERRRGESGGSLKDPSSPRGAVDPAPGAATPKQR